MRSLSAGRPTPIGAPSPPVDRIVGPGNAWVTAAKLEVAGLVGIDLPAGPSEGMVLADDARRSGDRRRRPRHPGRARPGFARDPRYDRAPPSPTPSSGRSRASCAPRTARDPRPRPRRPRPDRPGRRTSTTAIAFVDAYAPEHLSIDVRDADAVATGSATRARSSSGRGPPSPPATTRPARTTSCRPAGSPVRAIRSAVEAFGRFTQIQRVDERGLAAIRDDGRSAGDGRGPDGPPERGRERDSAPGSARRPHGGSR